MDDPLEAWFFADNRHDSRRVDNHAPSSPKPRICSRSALDSGGRADPAAPAARSLLQKPGQAFLSLPDSRTGQRIEHLAQGVPYGSGLGRARQRGNLGGQALGLLVLDIERHSSMVPLKVERYQP